MFACRKVQVELYYYRKLHEKCDQQLRRVLNQVRTRQLLSGRGISNNTHASNVGSASVVDISNDIDADRNVISGKSEVKHDAEPMEIGTMRCVSAV